MKILFVEDDETIAMGLIYSLEREGYEVAYAKNKKEALELLIKRQFELALLDITLPDGNGFEICTCIKKQMDIPVIFLTAYEDEGSVVMGLDMGGDDYVVKPFRIRELFSRIQSVTRRYGHPEKKQDFFEYQNIRLYWKQAKVYKDGEEVFLTAMEYKLLLTLMQNIGQVLTRSQLLEGIWDPSGEFVTDNTLTVYIKRLREKLEDEESKNKLIQTVRGMGYRLGN